MRITSRNEMRSTRKMMSGVLVAGGS